MDFNDIMFRFYGDIGMEPGDFRIIFLMIFSIMMISLLFFVLGFYTKAYKLLVESKNPEMTGEDFFQIAKWPITIVLCWIMLAFAGFYGIVEQTQWPSRHGHYVSTNTKTHSSYAINDSATGTMGIP